MADLDLARAFLDPRLSPLKSIIQAQLQAPPKLFVFEQTSAAPPHPSSIAPPLSSNSTHLVRATGYGSETAILSRHIAFVDISRLEQKMVADLESGRTNLGEIFARGTIEKHSFACGNDAEFPLAKTGANGCVDSFVVEAERSRPFLWRRYDAAFGGGQVAFVVLEIVPLTQAATRQLKEPDARG